MTRALGMTLGFVAAAMAVLCGIVTLNPLCFFEGGLIALNSCLLVEEHTQAVPGKKV